MSVEEVLAGQRRWWVEASDVTAFLRSLPEGCVQVCVTSPPYWQLRSYLKKDHPLKPLEIGQEPTPRAYCERLVGVFREVRRVLADHGTLWLNCGDSYAGGNGGDATASFKQRSNRGTAIAPISRKTRELKPLDQCCIPHRLYMALIADGWYGRADCIWHKPSCMPSSVKGWRWERCQVKVRGKSMEEMNPAWANVKRYEGEPARNGEPVWADCPGCKKCAKTGGLVLRKGSWRPTIAHEYIFLLSKSADYFCDGDAVRTPLAKATVSRDQYSRILDDPDEQFAVVHDHETVSDPGGANMRSVLRVGPEPLRAAHYAAFPTALVTPLLKASTSERGQCPACGMPWVRIIDRPQAPRNGDVCPNERDGGLTAEDGMDRTGMSHHAYAQWLKDNPPRTTGWRPSCDCSAGDPVPQIVLDIFAGSGRTGMAARRLGLRFLGCELNPEFAQLSNDQITADALDLPLAAGDKGPTLFDGLAATETPPLPGMED